MGVVDFVRSVERREGTLSVVNRAERPVVQEMLDALFDGQPVSVREEDDPAVDEHDLLLYETDDEVAVSSLSAVRDTLLTVNSDLYVTGARSLDDVDTPDVIAAMDELKFSVRGYPDTSKGKLMLIEMSRFIEARAYEAGVGDLHAGFQYLSRLVDERGTEDVYGRLRGTDVTPHVYGVPNELPDSTLDLTVHAEDCEELRTTWFVVYDDPTDRGRDAALVAVETGEDEENVWDGFWTYDAARVREIADYLTERY